MALTYRQEVNRIRRELNANPGRPLTEPAPKSSMSPERARIRAATLMNEARTMMAGVVPGQPVLSTRDRNRRERAWDKIHQANELLKAIGE